MWHILGNRIPRVPAHSDHLSLFFFLKIKITSFYSSDLTMCQELQFTLMISFKLQDNPCVSAQSLQPCPTLRAHGLEPARLLCPEDSPGKDTGVGCRTLLQGIIPTQGWRLWLLHCRRVRSRGALREALCVRACVLCHFTCLQLFCKPLDCSPPGYSAHEISQARILKWVVMPSSRGSSLPRGRTHISDVS